MCCQAENSLTAFAEKKTPVCGVYFALCSLLSSLVFYYIQISSKKIRSLKDILQKVGCSNLTVTSISSSDQLFCLNTGSKRKEEVKGQRRERERKEGGREES